MRWWALAAVTIVLLTSQSVLAPRLDLFGCRPDWLLVVVVFFSMHSGLTDALFRAWILGACADLMTIERAGFLALSYFLVALFVVMVRECLFRRLAITQFAVTLVTCLGIQVLWALYRRLTYSCDDAVSLEVMMNCATTALYTAVWAPPFHYVLLRMSKSLGIPRDRYSYAGLSRARIAGV